MQLQTNDLWMIQESETLNIYIGDRKRRGKLILAYDYASQFILNAQFCFITELATGGIHLLNELWRYGIPSSVQIDIDAPQASYRKQAAQVLGIHIITGKEEENYFETSMLKEHWKQRLDWIQVQKYKSLQEFKQEIDRLVFQWNQESSFLEPGISRATQYDRHIKNHIFMGKEVLRQSQLLPCKGKVTDEGTVQVFHRHYEVPEEYYGQQLKFYISLEQKQEVYILDEISHFVLHSCPLVSQE